jgi:hypothetical protein
MIFFGKASLQHAISHAHNVENGRIFPSSTSKVIEADVRAAAVVLESLPLDSSLVDFGQDDRKLNN